MEIPEQRKTKFVGKKGQPSSTKTTRNKLPIRRPNVVPNHILRNELLNRMIKELLPPTYQFEIHKTIHQVIENNVQTLGLQIPEGLLQFSLTISDLIKKFCACCQDVFILGDVTYGACCVDDFTAKALGCQMLVHYGHSCLIPVDQTSIKTLYVFVEIGIDRAHLRDTIVNNFPDCLHKNHHLIEGLSTISETRLTQRVQASTPSIQHISIEHEEETNQSRNTGQKEEITLAVVGTVQFVSAVRALKQDLEELCQPSINVTPDDNDNLPLQISTPSPQCCFKVIVPQVKPLSPGEILGCTAPKLTPDVDAIVYIGDGRFHLESIMIANPTIPAFRYDPYSKKLTYEAYDHFQMRQIRSNAINQASISLNHMASSVNHRRGRGDQDPSTGEAGNPDANDHEDHNVDVSLSYTFQPDGKSWAVVLGTLGRQGSLSVLKSISEGFAKNSAKTPIIPILISELSFEKLSKFQDYINVFVQTSCPRLSIDWGEGFLRSSSSSSSTPMRKDSMNKIDDGHEETVEIPFLNPYEAKVALGQAPRFKCHPQDHEEGLLENYPMDFYADNSLGDWTPRFGQGRPLRHHESQPPMTRQ